MKIKHYFRDKRNIVKVPRKIQELHSKVKRYIRENQKNGKPPTVGQIATALEVSQEKGP